MTPEQKVLNLKDSQKLDTLLKKLGIKIETERWWVHHFVVEKGYIWELFNYRDEDDKVNLHLSAPDAEELIGILPYKIIVFDKGYYLVVGKCFKGFRLTYTNFETDEVKKILPKESKSLVQALFAMFMWLDEKGLIK